MVVKEKARTERLQEYIDADLAELATCSSLSRERTRAVCTRLQRRIAMRNALRSSSEVKRIEQIRGIA